MDHNEAQQSQAVERYILNEMSADERDGFEEHYFDCRVCGEDVAAGAKLLAAGRRVAQESPTIVPMPRRWTAWLPAAAAAALLLITIGIGLPTGRTGNPSLEVVTLHETVIEASENRGSAGEPIVLQHDKPTVLPVAISSNQRFPRYEIVLRTAGGKIRAKHPVSAKDANDQIQLLIHSLPVDSYILAIEGVREDGNHIEIAAYNIQVR
jgi:hypothetical protein